MFNWLSNAWQWVTGIPNSVSQWVTGLLATLYTYVANWINAVYVALLEWANALNGFINEVLNWAESSVGALWKWVGDQVTYLINWAYGLYLNAVTYIEQVLGWAESEVGKLYAWIAGLIDGVYQWIIDNIWNPLFGEILGILRWIATVGAYMYNLLTNPELLLEFLGHYLLLSWMVLVQKFAVPFFKWLMHVMLSMAEPIGTILEDIISAIL